MTFQLRNHERPNRAVNADAPVQPFYLASGGGGAPVTSVRWASRQCACSGFHVTLVAGEVAMGWPEEGLLVRLDCS